MEQALVEKLLFAATACFRSDDFASASILYREVLHHDPENATALMMLGVLSQRAGQVEAAIQFLEMARAVSPDNAAIWINNALALEQAGRLREAGEAAEIALLLGPLSPEALDTAGYFSLLSGNAPLAVERHRKALSAAPDNARFLAHYGAALLGIGALQEAYQALKKTLRHDPQSAFAHHTLGLVLRAAGHCDQAIEAFQAAQKNAPHDDAAFIEEGKTHLLCGDFLQGWKKIEEALSRHEHLGLPLWNGKRVRHLILLAEKELENTLHFLRYFLAPALCKAAQKLTLVIDEQHHAFLRENIPGLLLVKNKEAAGVAEAEIPLRLLPSRLTKTALKAPPPLVFHAPEAEAKAWHKRLEQIPHPRIGLVWRRKIKDKNEGAPYLPPETVAPLVEEFGANIISLQSETPGLPFTASPLIPDLGAMAGLFSELDLLIAVDGPAAHLAGNMGLPVWLITPFAPSWRWQFGREDSPWYPSFRLFRQKKPDDWETVVQDLAQNLRRLMQGDKSVLAATPSTKPPLREHPQALKLEEG